jgi:hypothetical protein
MSPLDLAACISPLVPAAMLPLTLYGPWYATFMPPLQFATLVGEAALAAASHHTIPQVIAAAGFLLAAAGLAAIVLRDRWIEHRMKTLIDWRRFEQELASYADAPHPDGPRNDSQPHT